MFETAADSIRYQGVAQQARTAGRGRKFQQEQMRGMAEGQGGHLQHQRRTPCWHQAFVLERQELRLAGLLRAAREVVRVLAPSGPRLATVLPAGTPQLRRPQK